MIVFDFNYIYKIKDQKELLLCIPEVIHMTRQKI